jgi:hypothetical protein
MQTLWQNFRYGVPMLLKQSGFSDSIIALRAE